jgi:hypothetical protein
VATQPASRLPAANDDNNALRTVRILGSGGNEFDMFLPLIGYSSSVVKGRRFELI